MRENWSKHISTALALFKREQGKKKKMPCNKGHATPTLILPRYTPTTTYMPRGACKRSNTRCCWLAQLGEGAGSWSWRGISHPSVPSHRAGWPCQPSLGETVKTFPSEGVLWCSFEQSIPKTSSLELPFSQGQSLHGQESSAGDHLLLASAVYLAAASSSNTLFFFLCWIRQGNSCLTWIQCLTLNFISQSVVAVSKSVSMVVFSCLDDAKSCRDTEACSRM